MTFCSDAEDSEDTGEEPGAVTKTRGVANWRADAEEVEAGGPLEVEESAVETEDWLNMVVSYCGGELAEGCWLS